MSPASAASHRRRGCRREPRPPADAALFPVGAALGFVRRLREGIESGTDPVSAVASAVGGLPADAQEGIDRAMRRAAGDYTEDEWGFDEEFADAIFPFLEFMYERWWRVQVEGTANVPSHGRALMVANHAGIVPWDAIMMGTAIVKEHPLPRYPRFLVLNWAFNLPYISFALRKVGGVVASPYNAIRLLEQDELVGVFPEGVKGAGKDFKDRYRLQRFGRGGFIEIALRTRAPIVPVAVVGSEEIHPKIGESGLLARATGAPYFPITPTFPLLGPLGLVPLPSKWRIEFCEPIPTEEYGPEAAEDRGLVFELSEQVREVIQDEAVREPGQARTGVRVTRLLAALVAATAAAVFATPALAAQAPTREVLVVSNNWDGTADFIDTRTYKRVKRLNIIPDEEERVAEIQSNPADLGYFLAIQQLVGEGHHQYVDDSFTSPNGRFLYVSRPSFADVVAIDLKTDEIAWRVPVEGNRADHMAISHDGKRLLVSASTARKVHEINTRTGKITRSFESGDQPHENNYSADGETIFHASIGTVYTPTDDPSMDDTKGDRWFQVVDNDTFEIKKRIDMGQKLEEAGYPDQSSAVRPMALSPSERKVYFQVSFMHGFVEYDLRRDKVLRVKELPDRSGVPREEYLLDSAHHGLAMNPSGRSSAPRGRCRTTPRSSGARASSTRSSRSARSPTGRPTRAMDASASCRCRERIASRSSRTGASARCGSIEVGDHPQRMRMGEDPRGLPALARGSGGELVGRLGRRRPRELHALVLELAPPDHQDVARVVLVHPPRRPVALLRELVDRPQHVARHEVDERHDLHRWVRPSRRDLVVAVLVHVVEEAAHVLADQVALQRPRRVRVAERDREVRDPAEHHALVADGLAERRSPRRRRRRRFRPSPACSGRWR